MDYENAAYSPDTEPKSILKTPESEYELGAFSNEEEEADEDDELALLEEDVDSILEMDHMDVESLNTRKNVRMSEWRRGKFKLLYYESCFDRFISS